MTINLGQRIFTLLLAMLFSVPVNSLTLKIKKRRSLRNYTDSNVLVAQKFLKPGTVVTIPDAYVDAHFKGNKKDEMAILKWLANSHSLPLRQYQSSDANKVKGDYFVPVTIKGDDSQGFVTLRTLALKGNLELVTTEETPVFSENEVNNVAPLTGDTQIIAPPPKVKPENDELSSTYICTAYDNRNEVSLFENFNQQTQKIINSMVNSVALKAYDDFSNRGNIHNIIQNFNSTCQPISFDVFYNILAKKATEEKIPIDMLLGIMTQESTGRCNRSYNERNGSVSAGLFQINSGSSKVKSCGNSQEARVTGNCLENPFTNLNEAIRILKQKYSYLNNKELPQNPNNFDALSPLEKNKWRKTIAAYNGGEGYLVQAYNDIKAFNKKYKENLDPDNWDVRRIFMMRRAVERKGGKLGEKRGYKYARSDRNTFSNLGYVEAVVSSESLAAPNHSQKWTYFVDSHRPKRKLSSSK